MRFFSIRHRDFPIVCYFSSTYSLLLYLCYSSQKEINDTFFVFSETFPKELAKNFKNCCYIPNHKESPRFYVQKKWIISKYYKWFFIPRIKGTTKVFSQDHTTMFQLLIGNHPYIMVAETPIMEGILRNSVPKAQETMTKKQLINLWVFRKLIGAVYGRHWGFNDLCCGAIIEDEGSKKYFEGKKVILLNLKQAWNNKTESERNIILNLYGLKISELEMMKSKKIVVFTQPFVPEMSIEENQEYMARLINKYPHDDVVIKVHPRDRIGYKKLFPDVMVCNLRAPAQLLDILGVHFEIAATYNSAAVYDLSYDARIDWYAKELEYLCGKAPVPTNANLCRL